MKKYFFLLLLFFFSCNLIRYSRHKISIPRVDQTQMLAKNNLSLEGIWVDQKNKSVLILYNNGVFCGLYYFDDFSVEELKAFLYDDFEQNWERTKSRPYAWGIYNIEGQAIKVEGWVSTSGLERYPTLMESGSIINSTTIHTVREKKKSLRIFEEKEYTYKFVPFNKPDSTMRWFK